jgi:pimeloyl-ACP methyl ester carboxylesterase
VVAPFSRGYAPTAIPADGDYHIGALMYDAIALHRHLGAPADAAVIGHDWGAFTAIAMAADPNAPFGKVAALAAPVLVGLRTRPTRQLLHRLPSQARNSWYVLFHQLPGIAERTLDRVVPKLWRDWCPPGFDSSAEVERVWAALPDRAHRRAAIAYYRCQLQPRRQPPMYRTLHRSWRTQPLQIPILLVHGEIDGALDTQLATLSAACLPQGSRHEIISGAGHFMQLDQPGSVSQLILDYLSDG